MATSGVTGGFHRAPVGIGSTVERRIGVIQRWNSAMAPVSREVEGELVGRLRPLLQPFQRRQRSHPGVREPSPALQQGKLRLIQPAR